MKRRAALAAVLAIGLIGCTHPTGTGRAFWVPETWLGGDAAARRERAQDRADDAADTVLRGAQAAVVGADAALAADPEPTQPAAAAAELVGTARRNLDRALGPLPIADEQAAALLGRELALAQGQELVAARVRLERLQADQVRALERLAAAEAAVERATAATADAQRRYLAAQATVNRQRFMLWGSIILIIGLVVLVPGAASLVMFVMRRWKTAVSQIGSGIESWSAEHPDQAAELREWLSATMDKRQKLMIEEMRDSGSIRVHDEARKPAQDPAAMPA